jgi:hypothetical protein
MGEPLHNYENLVRSLRILTHDKGAGLSQRRITVSTSGLVPKLERLGGEDVRPNLAVSLNAPNDAIRDAIMPINRKWNIAKLLGALRAYPLEQRRRITFEYVLLAGVNDALDHAAQLSRLLRGIKCKVNLIPFNPHPEAPYARPSHAAVSAFQEECRRLGMPTYLRTPRGDDIDAACGQLANRSAGSPLVPLAIRKGPPPPPPSSERLARAGAPGSCAADRAADGLAGSGLMSAAVAKLRLFLPGDGDSSPKRPASSPGRSAPGLEDPQHPPTAERHHEARIQRLLTSLSTRW